MNTNVKIPARSLRAGDVLVTYDDREVTGGQRDAITGVTSLGNDRYRVHLEAEVTFHGSAQVEALRLTNDEALDRMFGPGQWVRCDTGHPPSIHHRAYHDDPGRFVPDPAVVQSIEEAHRALGVVRSSIDVEHLNVLRDFTDALSRIEEWPAHARGWEALQAAQDAIDAADHASEGRHAITWGSGSAAGVAAFQERHKAHKASKPVGDDDEATRMMAAAQVIADAEGAGWEAEDFAEPWMADLAHPHYLDIAERVVAAAAVGVRGAHAPTVASNGQHLVGETVEAPDIANGLVVAVDDDLAWVQDEDAPRDLERHRVVLVDDLRLVVRGSDAAAPGGET